MITWIQRTFQHHFRLIFGVLLFLIIISFVVIYNPSSGFGTAERQVPPRPFFGLNLSSEVDVRRLMDDAVLSVELQYGFSGADRAQIEQYAYRRQAAIHLADKLHVPMPSEAELKEFLKGLRSFAGANGEFDAAQYNAFRDSLKNNPRVNAGDVTRVLGNDWRVDRVQKLLGGPGYVTDADVKNLLVAADSTWTLAVASLDYQSFNPVITPSDAELARYFEQSAQRYQIDALVKATYIEIPAASFIDQVQVTDEEVKAFYEAQPARFTPPGKDPKEALANPAADLEAVRPQVVSALKLDRARRQAIKAASDIPLALHTSKVPMEGLSAFLAARGLTAKPLTPFSKKSGPPELGGSPQIAAELFRLDANRYYSDALPTSNGAAVVFWQETLPARIPLFAEVKDKVTADFVAEEKRRQFAELGKKIRSQIEMRLKNGEAFDKAVAAATGNAVKFETKTFAPFTRRQPPQDFDYSARAALDRLEKGQVSEMVIAQNKGFLVYAVDKKVPELTEANPQYVAAKANLASNISRSNAESYIEELVEAELAKSAPVSR